MGTNIIIESAPEAGWCVNSLYTEGNWIRDLCPEKICFNLSLRQPLTNPRDSRFNKILREKNGNRYSKQIQEWEKGRIGNPNNKK